MRGFWAENRIKLLLALVIYLISMGICSLIIMYVPYVSHREYLTELMDQVCAYYEETSELDPEGTFTLGALVYDSAGLCVSEKMPDGIYFDGSAEELFSPSVSGLLDRVLAGKQAVRVSFTSIRRYGVIVLGRPIYQNGQVTHALFLLRDLHDLYDTLRCICIAYTIFYIGGSLCLFSTMYKRQKYIGLQRNYVANISHDLKSPISSIRALTETVYERLPEQEEELKKYCGVVLRETVALEHTVKDILELSAVQSRQVDLSKSRSTPEQIFSATIEKYATLCYDMMIDFHVSDAWSQLPSVWTNPPNMARLLDILLSNAVKFVGEDGKIDVNAWADFKMVTIRVQDNGPGIDHTEQAKIFDRFYMGDPSHNAKGSGLGLAIAREITCALGERIWVESTPGQGSAFLFTIHLK